MIICSWGGFQSARMTMSCVHGFALPSSAMILTFDYEYCMLHIMPCAFLNMANELHIKAPRHRKAITSCST